MLTPMDSFLWEHLKEHVYAQRSTPTCYSVSDRMSCGPLPSTLKWTGAASNTYCNYEAPMIWSFDNLRHLTVTCILKTIRHSTYAVQHFRVLFKKKSHYGELGRKYFCALLMYVCVYKTFIKICISIVFFVAAVLSEMGGNIRVYRGNNI
jgi:hypothetical protein